LSVDVAVVVVSFNTKELLRRCLDSLTASLSRESLPSWTIVVVDNGSSDGSADLVRTNFPEVRLIALEENRGFAGANNVALRAVEASFVLLLNPDTEVLGDAPGALVRFLKANPSVGLAGGRLFNPDLSFQHSCFRFPTLAMTFLDFYPINHRLTNSRLNGRFPRSAYSRPFSIDHPLGACMIVRREVVERVGAFDEGFFMYCEEVDWCFRIRQAGWDIRYCPTAQVVHHVAASTRQVAGPMLIQLHRSRDRLFRKHYPPGFAWLAHQIVRLGMKSACRRAKRERAAGSISLEEVRRRLEIYSEIAE
jgi:N-acetylglucosaminyl-diphospho-decaprenol L-rhamnosyltransferase